MEKTYKDHLQDMLCDKKCSGEMTGYQHQAVDAMIELLSVCSYEELCEFAKGKMEGTIPDKKVNVGDTVYVLTDKCGCSIGHKKEVVECVVTKMCIKNDGFTIGYSCRGKYENGNNYIGNFVFKSIGKTVFKDEGKAYEALWKKQ